MPRNTFRVHYLLTVWRVLKVYIYLSVAKKNPPGSGRVYEIVYFGLLWLVKPAPEPIFWLGGAVYEMFILGCYGW